MDIPPTMDSSSESVPLVSVQGLVKQFQQGTATINALREVDLTIPQGKFVAIMGASGCGKSTLLHVMAGLTSPSAGTVCIEGTELSTLSDRELTRFRRRRIGLVFQAFNLIPTLTAEENIKLPLLCDQPPDDLDQRVDGLLERLGIAARRKHRPDALSGGEQQRVAIARALITEPALILADEPTGNLDSQSGQAICQLLQELCQEQQRTIVVVTHESGVAAWAERIVIMKDGRIVDQTEAEKFEDALSVATHYQSVLLAQATT